MCEDGGHRLMSSRRSAMCLVSQSDMSSTRECIKSQSCHSRPLSVDDGVQEGVLRFYTTFTSTGFCAMSHCIYPPLCVYARARVCACVCVCMCAHVHACVRVRVRVRVRVCLGAWCLGGKHVFLQVPSVLLEVLHLPAPHETQLLIGIKRENPFLTKVQ